MSQISEYSKVKSVLKNPPEIKSIWSNYFSDGEDVVFLELVVKFDSQANTVKELFEPRPDLWVTCIVSFGEDIKLDPKVVYNKLLTGLQLCPEETIKTFLRGLKFQDIMDEEGEISEYFSEEFECTAHVGADFTKEDAIVEFEEFSQNRENPEVIK